MSLSDDPYGNKSSKGMPKKHPAAMLMPLRIIRWFMLIVIYLVQSESAIFNVVCFITTSVMY